MRDESGNILFYILIAVMLLGALSFAVTQGSRDSVQNMNQDKGRLLATGIIDYGDTIKKAVDTIRLRGAPFTALSFADPALGAAYGTAGTAPKNEVFNTAGGAAVYTPVAADALAAPGQPYIFTAGNEIKDVGTTCGADACADLLLLLPGLTKDICVTINTILGVGNPAGDPPVDSGADTTAFAGTATYAATIGDEPSSAALAGRTAGCFLDTAASSYTYFQVLQAR
jgi:hypothetical protein